ncbi:hypothetical protein SKAU_G00362010 [Synaphobranchus kaupii]|uniref:Integrase catalytic domain-containing protein n=1 Tax=Synaphobranchus kaupii TaxID=118154 RepID=A0A9Q1EIJ5_SYNKA|nr:hypothetical protein SKAU_G00362010 [Synaphobranchus kaupii]
MVSAMEQTWDLTGTSFQNHSQIFCQQCVICAQNNVGKGVKTTLSATPIPRGPFDYLMMDFVELTPCNNKKYCLVIINMFSRWIEAFPTTKEDASAVAKVLIGEIIPRWGIPRKISSDNGSHFCNGAIKLLARYLGIDLRFHCAYHPASGGVVERANGTLKSRLAKVMQETGLNWIQALPTVLAGMRGRTHSSLGMSPYEVLMGRPMHVGYSAPREVLDLELLDTNMVRYCTALTKQLRSVHQQVKVALPKPGEGQFHKLQPGDWVLIKDFRRKKWHQARWRGPYQILLTTPSAVRVAERATWVHASHCKLFAYHEPERDGNSRTGPDVEGAAGHGGGGEHGGGGGGAPTD